MFKYLLLSLLLLTGTLLYVTQGSKEKGLLEKAGSLNEIIESSKKDKQDSKRVPTFNFISKQPTFVMQTNQKLRKLEKNKKRLKTNHKPLSISLDRTVLIAGPIGPGVLAAADAIAQLDKQNKNVIYVVIDSPGGSVFDGARVVAAMQEAKSPIVTVCLRMCGSMAFIIHQYGDKRFMLDRAVLMSHFAATSIESDVERIKSYIDVVNKYITRFSTEIAARAGMSLEKYENLIARDLWMTEEDAVTLGFSDGTVNAQPK